MQKHDIARPVGGQLERRALRRGGGRRRRSGTPRRPRERSDGDRQPTAGSTVRRAQTPLQHVDDGRAGAIQSDARRSPRDPPQIVDDRVDDDRRDDRPRFHVVEVRQSAAPGRRRPDGRRRCPRQDDRDAMDVGDQAETEASHLRPAHRVRLHPRAYPVRFDRIYIIFSR